MQWNNLMGTEAYEINGFIASHLQHLSVNDAFHSRPVSFSFLFLSVCSFRSLASFISAAKFTT